MVVGEVSLSNDQLRELLKIETSTPFSRTGLLSGIAIQECLENAGMAGRKYEFVNSTSTGGIDRSEIYYKNHKGETKADHADLIVHDSGDVTTRLNRHFDMPCSSMTISTACSSGANAIMLGARMIKNGMADAVLVGGGDALTNFTINGFNSLGILDPQHCKPFSGDRKGLNLGEGAAYLMLESERHANQRGANIYGHVKGWSNTNDAFHQTASSPEGKGATKAMQLALNRAALKPKDIDYINVHGTGTQNNDASEGQALLYVFEILPPFSSTKAFTGHTLAAAGSLEAVFSILSIQHNIIPPNLNFNQPLEVSDLKPQTHLLQEVTVNTVLSNSFGFGGNNTSLIFTSSSS